MHRTTYTRVIVQMSDVQIDSIHRILSARHGSPGAMKLLRAPNERGNRGPCRERFLRSCDITHKPQQNDKLKLPDPFHPSGSRPRTAFRDLRHRKRLSRSCVTLLTNPSKPQGLRWGFRIHSTLRILCSESFQGAVTFTHKPRQTQEYSRSIIRTAFREL